jgi:hypothetical protein
VGAPARQKLDDIINELPDLTMPTLVLVGDAFGKIVVHMTQTTAEGSPSAAFQVLPGGGDLAVACCGDFTALSTHS